MRKLCDSDGNDSFCCVGCRCGALRSEGDKGKDAPSPVGLDEEKEDGTERLRVSGCTLTVDMSIFRPSREINCDTITLSTAGSATVPMAALFGASAGEP